MNSCPEMSASATSQPMRVILPQKSPLNHHTLLLPTYTPPRTPYRRIKTTAPRTPGSLLSAPPFWGHLLFSDFHLRHFYVPSQASAQSKSPSRYLPLAPAMCRVQSARIVK